MIKRAGSLVRYPARALVTWYVSAVLVGGFALTLPEARQAEAPVRTLDGLFTATSAVCVTGLTVRSTGQDFSFLGQAAILLLIQLGGLGIMTITTFAVLAMTGRAGLRHQAVISDTLGARPREQLRQVMLRVVGTTLTIEAIGAVLLFPRFCFDMAWPEALWWAVFHSVSAYCNAGFALDDQSLIGYQGDLWVNAIVMALIVIGGLGFPVLADLMRTPPFRRPDETRRQAWARAWGEWNMTTRLVLIVTAFLLAGGTVLFLLLEWNHALADMPWQRRLLVAAFQSVTMRTAGFNTVDFAGLASSTLFVTMLWMFVGGGPCSTAGGAKTSTFAILVLLAWNRLTGREQVVVFRRAIDRETIDRAITTVLLFALFSTLGLAGILVGGEALFVTAGQHQEHDFFIQAAFETISALCTVGLSTGVTAELSDWSKACLMGLMLAGRLGPISVVLALSRRRRMVHMKLAEQDVLIG